LPGASLNIPQQPGVGPKDEEERKRWMETPPVPKVAAPVAPAPQGIKPAPGQNYGQFTDKQPTDNFSGKKRADPEVRESTGYSEDQALARIIDLARR
jgi:hypothetical protein